MSQEPLGVGQGGRNPTNWLESQLVPLFFFSNYKGKVCSPHPG